MNTQVGLQQWTPTGPVAAAFMLADDPVRGIMGPIGSAKTTTCLQEIVRRATQQEQSPIDGKRYFKAAIIRDTYRNLNRTTLKSWLQWFPKTMGKFTGGSGGEPAVHHILFRHVDGTLIDLIVEFIALGDRNIEEVMRGWEGTMVYFNECDGLLPEALVFARGRIGRYPGKRHGGATWYGIICDWNAREHEHWTSQDFFLAPKAGYRGFRQPSGFSPVAENIDYLPKGYYAGAAEGQPEDYVRRMIENKFGYSRDGKPVYPEFDDSFHIAKRPLMPTPGMSLEVGADAGLSPAIIIGQPQPSGQMRILKEIVPDDMGAVRCGEMVAKIMATEYQGLQVSDGWGDPAGWARSSTDERSWSQTFEQHSGIKLRPASTNTIVDRIEAVRKPLTQLSNGEPRLLISPTCVMLRRGFNAGYRFKKVILAGGSLGSERYEEKPEKNEFSHPHDGLQYLMLGSGQQARRLHQQATRSRLDRFAQPKTQAATNFKMFGNGRGW